VSLLITDIFNLFAGTVMILSLLSCQQGITQRIGLPLGFGWRTCIYGFWFSTLLWPNGHRCIHF
jgi:hypothetical protein